MQKFFKKKTLASLIAIALMLTIVISMAYTPQANAAYGDSIKTWYTYPLLLILLVSDK